MANDLHRSKYHFTPPANWLNDPNGLVYHAGEYHLFYQYHPHSTVWGPMHWGHAVSPDLVHWEHLPIALYPDELGMIFSGCAVTDPYNTAGFGADALLALFTHHKSEGSVETQSQSLAFSTDHGRTWTKYAGNPVLPSTLRDFRDPKVFWYGPPPTASHPGHWVMCLAVGQTIQFHTSPDLLTWQFSGSFGPQGSTVGVWETPDLFSLPVEDGPETRWVLTMGVGDGGPGGGSGTQYFVGYFDGKTFTSENPPDTILWADFGADFYAPQSWYNTPDGRRLAIAWMSNWQYARTIPADTVRGALTLPRVLTLTHTADGPRLLQHPIPELQILRSTHQTLQHLPLTTNYQLPITNHQQEILAEFHVPPNADQFGLRLHTREGEHTLGYLVQEQQLYVDRSASGDAFHPEFPKRHLAPLPLLDGNLLRLHLFVDTCSLEVFANDGMVTMTDLIFPRGQADQLELFVEGGEVTLHSLDIYELKPASFSPNKSQ